MTPPLDDMLWHPEVGEVWQGSDVTAAGFGEHTGWEPVRLFAELTVTSFADDPDSAAHPDFCDAIAGGGIGGEGFVVTRHDGSRLVGNQVSEGDRISIWQLWP